jgi:catechol 2,3-dioxygenase-like lactoylglutathione lyase family enzyme
MSTPSSLDANGFVMAQFALNTADMAGSLKFYTELFGFQNADGHPSWGEVSRVQGLPPDAHWMTWWMVGSRPFFQLELFMHSRPKQRPQPEDWRPSDYGWTRVGLAVDEFDRVVSGLERWQIPVLGSKGDNGRRRLAFRDPYVGCIFEVMESASAGPTPVYAACSVADLAQARRRYQDILGAEILPLERLHLPEDEALWGLAGAEREGFLARVGDTYLEILSYGRPAGRPRPVDHRICDQGIMNIALGTRDVGAVRALTARVISAGLKTTGPVDAGRVAGLYIVEPDFELELMGAPPEVDAKIGFTALAPFGAIAGLPKAHAAAGEA